MGFGDIAPPGLYSIVHYEEAIKRAFSISPIPNREDLLLQGFLGIIWLNVVVLPGVEKLQVVYAHRL